MINQVELKNFGPMEQLNWQGLGKINLIIGNNDCGKSFLLKALYSAMRTLEEYKRGENPQSLNEILVDKIFWTFQSENIGNLVNYNANSSLSFNLDFENKLFKYDFSRDTKRSIRSLHSDIEPRQDNSIFLPAKEVLSIYHFILESEINFRFGFDSTYMDLANALKIPATKAFPSSHNISLPSDKLGRDSDDFNQARNLLANLINGKIEFDEVNKRWYFHKDKQRFPMGVTAEGIKKIAILDTLLGNGYLNENSIIFIDELESALHPEAISKLLDIIAILAKHGIQFFIASHSYFVIKKLCLIAQEQKMSIPVISKENNDWVSSDLLEEIPDNAIINESIRLYQQEVSFALA
ncbi:MAG: AAA family ATPase [Methylococcaceae bacterium]|nr:AAA family ATPase [Methylococcaceae bacterium]